MKAFALTAFALTAFAFNSILCRLALRGEEADAVGFTVVRLVSGAVTLVVIGYFFRGTGFRAGEKRALTYVRTTGTGSWPSAFFLFAYAICFSFAYLGLTTATGALILFGCVQFTMIGVSVFRGERPTGLEWIGLIVAVSGLIYLVLPGLSSPPLLNALLMATAGVAWGFYTLRGKGSEDPLGDTAGNFVRAVPMAILIALPFLSKVHLSMRGILLAVLSGAVASGIGYTVWYSALKYHTSTRAAVLQLAVPVIAAVGGIVLLLEVADLRILVASVLILGGIAIAVFGKNG